MQYSSLRRLIHGCLVGGLLLAARPALAQNARITVDASRVTNRITPWMYGSCIEDVNHEIYGGFYDQKIFGESFEEPPPSSTFAGWTNYGGNWQGAKGNNTGTSISVAASAGSKLVREGQTVGDGIVTADITFPDARGDNAGLLVRVSQPGIGADNFDGYEISLSASQQHIVLGKHRHNWQLLRQVPVQVVVGRANHLRVELAGPRARISLNGGAQPLIDYTDTDAPFLTGQVALRTWNADAAFADVQLGEGRQRGAEQFVSSTNSALSGQWDAVRTGTAKAEYVHDARNPYNGTYSQMVRHGAGSGTVGVANRGLNRWGIAAHKGKPLQGRVYLRADELSGPVTVALQSADGTKTYATHSIRRVSGQWAKYPFTLAPDATDKNARFEVWLDRPGTLWIDQAVLMGTGAAQFKGAAPQALPLRADIGQALVEQGLTFMRYGGTMVNAPGYRWKKMIGDRDQRPPYRGHWYPYSTNGFGIEEFLQFCEAARIEAAFAINIEEAPQDAADLVEYLNGAATTPWGKVRAANGHPQPYNVRWIEIGNEEVIGSDDAEGYQHYIERFKLLHAAMHAKDPTIQFVNAAWWRPESPNMATVFKALEGMATYWDLHVWADDARSGTRVDKDLAQMQSLFQQWVPGTKTKVVIFEENGNLHNMQRALGHATVLNATRRHGDFVLVSCPANALQPWGQNDNGWNQGQIFFTPDRVWGMPPYYAQQMTARNHQPLRVVNTLEGGPNLDVTATRSEDGKTLVLHVVNTGSAVQSASLALTGFAGCRPTAQVWTLSAPPQAVNAPASPEAVRVQESTLQTAGTAFNYTFAANSYTILRLTRG